MRGVVTKQGPEPDGKHKPATRAYSAMSAELSKGESLSRRSLPEIPIERGSATVSDAVRTEYAFVLPRGYVDGTGTVHRDGVMRLATARDEIIPQRDPRVRENDRAARFDRELATDLAFLQDLYRRINQEGHTQASVTCPACNHAFTVDVAGEQRLGES